MLSGPLRILADTSYATLLPDADLLENEIQRRFGATITGLAKKLSSIRGILAWWIARDYNYVVTVNHWPGARWLIFLTAWLSRARRRKIILLEFINYPERWISRLAFAIWMPLILRPSIRRVMVAAQVMTPVDVEYYSRQLRIPRSFFHIIPLPLIEDYVPERAYSASDAIVFASGRGTTDWRTLFKAAEGSNWKLVVVCSRHDRKLVDRLNKDGLAVISSEVPVAEHARIMACAAVYVMPLQPRPISCGQIRIRNAISAGTPIVCTGVVGVNGYAIQGQTASIVDVGDHLALRREVERLLSDAEERRTLALRAREIARPRSPTWFSEAIREFVRRVAEENNQTKHD